MSESILELKAIYPNAGLDSYYNQHENRMVLEKNRRSLKCTRLRSAESELLDGESIVNVNLLSVIGVQIDSRLNILLEIIPKTRLTSIIDYPFPIDEYTRILHYTYKRNVRNLVCTSLCRLRCCLHRVPANATHQIVEVTLGIEFVALFRLPHDQDTVTKIDEVLVKLNTNLKARVRQQNQLRLTSEEENNLEKITHTNVYSNNPKLTDMKTIIDIYQNIHLLQKKKRNRHRPITLILQPVHPIHLSDANTKIKEGIEDHLLSISKAINWIKGFLEDSPSSSKYLGESCAAIAEKYSEIEKHYQAEIKRWRDLIIESHNGKIDELQVTDMLHDEQCRTLKKKLKSLSDEHRRLQEKEELIKALQQKSLQYHSVSQHVYAIGDVRKVLQQLIQTDQYDRFLCSTDSLNKNKAEFQKAQDQLVKEHARQSTLRLVYVDFSSCTFQLSNIIVVSKENINNILPDFDENCINIVLLGESGVGKSTFINAFVNYLTFDSLTEAELSSKPVIAIPVSFLITTGDNFDEHMVKFGDVNFDDNEDFDHPGQSVTQQCRCYHFNLPRQHGKRLRIIDTPGFGDTRGLEQDDRNIQHIFQYLHQFSHINAICFLLKSNSTRLVISFRSCLLQFYQILDSNIRQNIIFCFTNARASFYTPGNTGPLLREMLNSLPSKDIQFKKENVFCFDNEAFRYLVAIQNRIYFSELDRNEYDQSWSKSVNQSNQMIDYICQILPQCPLDDRWKSLPKIQETITTLIHPILEAMRNIFRSMISSSTSTHSSMLEILFNGCIEFSQFFANMNRIIDDPISDAFRKMIAEEKNKRLLDKLEEQMKKYAEQMRQFQGNPNKIDLSNLTRRITEIENILSDPKQPNVIQDRQSINQSDDIITQL